MPPNSTDPVRSPSYRWWVVFMLWFVCLFNYADRQAISSVFPELKREFGFDKVQLGLIGSAFMWVYALGGPFAGYVGDRVRRKDLILGGCLFWSGVTMLTGWCGRLWQFVAVRALEGFGETFYFPASMSLMSDYHGQATRSKALAFHQSSVYWGRSPGAGSGRGSPSTMAGGWVSMPSEGRGWFSRWCSSRSSGSPSGAKSEGLERGPAEPPMSWREVCATLFRSPTALLLMAAFLAANFVATIFLTWTPTFLVEKFGFELTAAGLSGSVFIHSRAPSGRPWAGSWRIGWVGDGPAGG